MALVLSLGVILFYGVANGEIIGQNQFLLKDVLRNGWLEPLAEYVAQNEDRQTTNCAQDLLLWKKSMTSVWALQMVDSCGKFPSGLTRGNGYAIGHFDECLAVSFNSSERKVNGKYCPSVVTVFGTDLGFAICMPDSCSAKQMQDYIFGFLASLNLGITKPIVQLLDVACSTSDAKEWTGGEIAAVVVFSFIGGLIAISTVYELITHFYLKKKYRGHDFYISFSLYTNTSKLTKINKSTNSIRCLNGLRVLSLFWIMICHRYSNTRGYPIQNIFDLADLRTKLGSMLIFGGGIAVDTFFVLSGFLLAYLFCNVKKNTFSLPLFYLHRFLRLWPAMAALVFFVTTIFKRIGTGPAWPLMALLKEEKCDTDWWVTLLYVQNYVSGRVMCMNHLWYMAVDTQIYILSPILLYPILRKSKFALPNIIFWYAAAQITTITVAYANQWGGILAKGDAYWTQYYNATHTRAAVWLLGFLAGYLMHLTKNRVIKIDKIIVVILWLVALFILGISIFGIYGMIQPGHKINALEDSTFNAFFRTGWAIAIIWIIFASLRGYGGPVNWILSFRIWEVLGRLSYSMYLIHIFLQNWKFGTARIIPHFNHFSIIYAFFGDIIINIMVAYVWVMAFESPFLALEKAIFHKRTSRPEIPISKDRDEPVFASTVKEHVG